MTANPEEDLPFIVEPLDDHDRADFSCGDEHLDKYFTNQIGQDHKKNVAVPFVLIDEKTKDVAGFYTLSATTVVLSDLPSELAKRLPKYPKVPATLIGRLAIDLRYRGRKLGEYLLMDALRRALEASKQVGSMAVIVDAKNDAAKHFYQRFDFREFRDQPYRLFLPLKTISGLF